MTICDKCGSNAGTARFRFIMSSLGYPDDKLFARSLCAVETDLCGKCCDYIREHEFSKAIYRMSHPGEPEAMNCGEGTTPPVGTQTNENVAKAIETSFSVMRGVSSRQTIDRLEDAIEIIHKITTAAIASEDGNSFNQWVIDNSEKWLNKVLT